MLHPTIQELTKDEFNRYELALATAKCARILTDEYVKQREEVERAMATNKDNDRLILSKVDEDLKDEKAIKNAITRFSDGRYEIYRGEPEEIVYVSRLRPVSETEEVFDSVEADVDDEDAEDEVNNFDDIGEVEDTDEDIENTDEVEDGEEE